MRSAAWMRRGLAVLVSAGLAQAAGCYDLSSDCKGGQGGTGGKGGGGRGGHTIGIAHTGEAPSLEGLSIETGTPGSGGVGDGPSGNGGAGVKAEVQQFP